MREREKQVQVVLTFPVGHGLGSWGPESCHHVDSASQPPNRQHHGPMRPAGSFLAMIGTDFAESEKSLSQSQGLQI